MPLNIALVLIDCQNDFMGEDDGTAYTVEMGTKKVAASLPVQGAVSDMKRLAALVDRVGPKLNSIQVTLDSHRVIDVGNPGMWQDSQGKPPTPFTIITTADIENGVWAPRNPGYRKRLLDYSKALDAGGNYAIMAWPEHCLIGTWGHNVQDDLMAALQRWERREFANVDYVVKGANPFTEHYGALQAEVPDPTDPSTQLNADFLKVLQEADIIGCAGEASSHCVKATIQQIADNIGDDHLKKMYLLTDCMSPVAQQSGGPNFPAIAKRFLAQMAQRGMTLTTSTDFLA